MKFREIFGGFNLFLGTLGKGSCRVSNLFFLGGSNPGKRESANLRLLLDYFLFFLGGRPWKRESIDLRLLWDFFVRIFIGGKP